MLIRTLAYHLGTFDNRIGSAIARVVMEVPNRQISTTSLAVSKLLVEHVAGLEDCFMECPNLMMTATHVCVREIDIKAATNKKDVQTYRLVAPSSHPLLKTPSLPVGCFDRHRTLLPRLTTTSSRSLRHILT